MARKASLGSRLARESPRSTLVCDVLDDCSFAGKMICMNNLWENQCRVLSSFTKSALGTPSRLPRYQL
ncbi:hypothetical protein EMEDMD4_760020 [Sinorhizobium medicae]|uniref:Uncharacterized protein n=1 Tax=Sinorhizobium medicae TaxID=110321 RepID=A0A508XAA4_9HYPH|nr:hypothetical protein EMEDMD4_760020 [Sinorhizobium medicae]